MSGRMKMGNRLPALTCHPFYMKAILLILIALAGAGLTFQIAWNARLREAAQSPILAVIVSLVMSLLAASAVWLTGIFPRGSLPRFGSVPLWSWCGGLFATFYLVVTLLALPRYGAAIVVALVVAGQMAAGLYLDGTGAFGVQTSPLTLSRIAGALLIIGGVMLIQNK